MEGNTLIGHIWRRTALWNIFAAEKIKQSKHNVELHELIALRNLFDRDETASTKGSGEVLVGSPKAKMTLAQLNFLNPTWPLLPCCHQPFTSSFILCPILCLCILVCYINKFQFQWLGHSKQELIWLGHSKQELLFFKKSDQSALKSADREKWVGRDHSRGN